MRSFLERLCFPVGTYLIENGQRICLRDKVIPTAMIFTMNCPEALMQKIGYPAILEENDYEMLMVINRSRPLSHDAPSTLEIMREIETAGGIRFTGLSNNTNLGAETTAEDILDSIPYAEEVSTLSGLPIVATSVRQDLAASLEGKVDGLFPIVLHQYQNI